MAKSPRAKKKAVKPAKNVFTKAALKKQTVRDVIVTPTMKQIETSIDQGKTVAASTFRSLMGW